MLSPHFERIFGDKSVLREWFSLLLLHFEVATLAGPYFDFGMLAGAALAMVAASRSHPIEEMERQEVLDAMVHLPPHPEVIDGLDALQHAGFRMVTLTNSSLKAIEQQIRNAGLTSFFERNFSVDPVRRYKPAPETCQMVAAQLGVETSQLRMVAAHAWDIVGAMRAGCSAAFVERPGKTLIPLVEPPDVIGHDLLEVAEQVIQHEIR
ncbi:MAG: 2-haloacid dehalogenase [Bryobacterales bacterium]|nr:2-haloacid dehalogenase [Bryobacterales bacterium]